MQLSDTDLADINPQEAYPPITQCVKMQAVEKVIYEPAEDPNDS